jgi:hypothetical protein
MLRLVLSCLGAIISKQCGYVRAGDLEPAVPRQVRTARHRLRLE